MMKKIASIIKMDFANALRDNMVIYLLLAPVLLAVGLRLFIPVFESPKPSFAVLVPEGIHAAGPGTEGELALMLAAYGKVEQFKTEEDLQRRVLAADDTGGFVRSEDGAWSIILEGNESAGREFLMQVSLSGALAGITPEEITAAKAAVDRGAGAGGRSPIRNYAAVGLMMLSSLIGGLAVSFAMVEEKEQKVTLAFSVTPLTPAAYFAARGILAAGIGFVAALAGHFILMGTEAPAGLFLLALLASAPLPLAVVLLIGGIAKNQIQALAVIKILMMIYLALPFATILVPKPWRRLFYPLPNYWAFRTFENLYVTGARAGDFPLAASVTFFSGAALLVILVLRFGKQLKPR